MASEAGDGLTAITEYERTHPDIALMDITMPQMEGIEAAEKIVRAHPEARIVMVSSVGYQENIVAALQRGARHLARSRLSRKSCTKSLSMFLEKMVRWPARPAREPRS